MPEPVYRLTYTERVDGLEREYSELCSSYHEAKKLACWYIKGGAWNVIVHCPITNARGKVLYYDREEVYP